MCELKISTLRSAFGGLWWVSRFHTLSIYINKLYIYIQYVYIYYMYMYIYICIYLICIYIYRGCPTATEERSWSFGWSMMQQIPILEKGQADFLGIWCIIPGTLNIYFYMAASAGWNQITTWKMDVSPKNQLKWRCLGYQVKCLKHHIFIRGINLKSISFDKGSSCYQSHRLDNHLQKPTSEQWRKTWLFRVYRGFCYAVIW